jgi:putative permease
VYAPSIYSALLLFLLTVIGLYLLVRLEYLLTVLFLAVLLACGIAGPVRRLEEWRLPRALAILVVYLVIFGVLAAIAWYVLPRLVGQANNIAEDLPREIQQAERVQQRIDDLAVDYPILNDLNARLLGAATRASGVVANRVLELPRAIAKAVFSLLSIFTIASLLLVTKERLLGLIVSLMHPRHRQQTWDVLSEIGDRLGAYLRAKVIVMVIVGTLIYLTLFFLGSSYAVLVAIFAGIFEALPRIGPWVGRFAIVLALLPLGWEKVAIGLVAHVVIENLKGYVLSPVIESDQVDIHPLTAFIAIIAGGLLLGWLGAFIAVPVAAIVQVVVDDVLIPWRRSRLAPAELEFAAVEQPSPPQPPSPARGRGGSTDGETARLPLSRAPGEGVGG